MGHDKSGLNTSEPTPPKWADKFLEWYCAPHQLEDVQGALYEYFYDRVEKGQARQANWFFILDVITHFRPHIIKRESSHLASNSLGMYIKTSIRNFRKNQLASILNVVGLTISITSFLLILIWINQEKSFDAFHENAANIYRIPNTFKSESESFSQAVSGPALGAQLHKLFPQIVNATRFGSTRAIIKSGDQSYFENRIRIVDPNFFEMFSWEVLAGNKADFLKEVNSIVLTESLAKKYFGEKPALGQTLIMDNERPLKVTGILKDPPVNSQLQFEAITSMDLAKIRFGAQGMDSNWGGGSYYTYLQLEPNTDREALMVEVNKFITSKLTFFTERNMSYQYFLQPLTSIHLSSDLRYDFSNNGSARNVSIFTAIAFIILLLACINYINLSTANALRRAKEVGIKKVVGALRTDLIKQFLIESTLICFVSALIALGLVYFLLPNAENFFGYAIALDVNAQSFLWLLLGTLALGLVAGFFPAFSISSFKPLSVIKGQLKSGKQGSLIRKSLVVLQFTATIALIIAIITVNGQLRYIQNQDLGMQTDEVIYVSYRGLQSVNDKQEILKNELLKNSKFKSISFYRNSHPVGGLSNSTVQVETEPGKKVSSSLYNIRVDESYAETYGIELAAGRFFSEAFPTDSTQSVLVNEAAVESFGWGSPDQALGKKMGAAPFERTVVGVVKNFNFEGLHKEVEPVRILPIRNKNNYAAFALKADLSDPFKTLGFLEETWREINPEVPLDYTIMNEDIRDQYQGELRFRSIFLVFSVLSLIIACLGLLGLATASTHQRIKEIGIRKVLGASTFNLINLLSREFLFLVALSLILATPLAWYGMEQWLSTYAYRINMSWVFFLLAGCIALGIALITISYQTLKAALRNPVLSLRNE
ncbi:MAG: ABC transporter permease [Saprospiraceae bacterium]|nr:ABC transporter permease [Saprospiraceae bacterium]